MPLKALFTDGLFPSCYPSRRRGGSRPVLP